MFPDPLKAAKICRASGADSIVCHLRVDRRHIQDRDVLRLRKGLRTRLNLEMSTNNKIVKVALTIKPDQATLVPEKRQELTTEGGLDVIRFKKKTARVVRSLQESAITTSIFIDPKKQQIKASKDIGAPCIELHTGRYANAITKQSKDREFKRLKDAAFYAHSLGLGVNAGHGLDYKNVGRIAAIEVIEELNIGFSIIAASVFIGLGDAVKQMILAIRENA
jgi:pyridoxine 5-phosphate synthase